MNRCKKCGLKVYWENKQCFNPDKTSHWDLCRETTFREIKAFGIFFIDKVGEGYEFEWKKYYTEMDVGIHEGAEFEPCPKDIVGECKTPPWEICYDCEE
mgnify:CR=1 FL=1